MTWFIKPKGIARVVHKNISETTIVRMEAMEGLYKAILSVQSARLAVAANGNLCQNGLFHGSMNSIK